MKIELKQGTALVLVGPQGSGKTYTARRLAEHNGAFAETTLQGLDDHFHNFSLETKTIIVEGFPEYLDDFGWLEPCVTSPLIRTFRKYQPGLIIPTPNFIFCTLVPPKVTASWFTVIQSSDFKNIT